MTIEFDDEMLREIIYTAHEDFEPVTDEEMEDQRRWAVRKSRVFKHKPTEAFYDISWDEGATEYQEGIEPNFYVCRSEPVSVTITRYVAKEEVYG